MNTSLQHICIPTLVLMLNCTFLCAQKQEVITSLNSPLDEQNPIVSPDGQTMYFTISNHPQNVGGKKDLGDVWFSKMTEAGWGPLTHGGIRINNSLHNTIAGFSPDGSQMFLMGHYAENGKTVTTQGLSVSYKENEEWSLPRNIAIPYFKNKTPFQSGCISADKRVLVFSAESFSTFGAEDIYVSIQSSDEKWSEPKNLGSVINTAMQDVSPSLSADGKILFFASNGRKGMGSFDLYKAERLDDTWLNWSEPVNLGPEVNTEGRELFYRLTEFGGFYTSTQNSDGYGDIRFYRPKDFETVSVTVVSPKAIVPDSAIVIKEVVYEKETSAIATTRLWGKVVNAKTEKPVEATFHFISSESREIKSSATGDFNVDLPGITEYVVKVEAPGYISVRERLDLRTQVMDDLEMNFRLQPAEVGTTVNLKNVLFVQSTPKLLEESYDELDMVVDFMNANPSVQIELAGHTDNQGYHNLNMKLSRERVEEVKKYLVSKGIDGKRITGKGHGGTKPIADNEAEETRRLNRRVEFTIVKD